MSGSLITGLEFTLQRLNSIDSNIERLLGTSGSEPSDSCAVEFKEILDKKIEEDKGFDDVVQDSTQDIAALVEKYANKQGLDVDFVNAVIKQESGFNPDATSSCGAMGLMQLMPETARGLGVSDAYNVEQNIDGGTKYLKSMMNRFNNDPKLALAAYNAGPGAVDKYGDIPPYKETQNYVKNIMSAYDSAKGGKV